SYTANPLGCAAALASLDIFQEEQTLEKLSAKIHYMEQALAGISQHPHVGAIRQIGFIAGIDIVKVKASARAAAEFYPWQEQQGAKVCDAAKKHGFLTRPIRDTLVFMPP